jgi:TPR repeat protein
LLGLAFALPLAAGDFYAALDAYKREEFKTALHEWSALAEKGDAESQYRVGRLFAEGKGTDVDDASAIDWYRRAALQGHARAQSSLGFMLELGRGVERDISEAVDWYEKAARQGRAAAASNLGRIYESGSLGSPDVDEALRWYRQAAAKDDIVAATALGRMAEEGRGMEPDEALAFKWFKRGAKREHPEALFRLGRLYAEGRGTQQNRAKALKYLDLAATRGNEPAQRYLDRFEAQTKTSKPQAPAPTAVTTQSATSPRVEPPPAGAPAQPEDAEEAYRRGRAFLLGDGLPVDPGRAADWLRRAAEQGHADAAYRLALMHYRGHGKRQPKNVPLAYYWFTRAARSGIQDAENWRTRLEGKLTARERAEIDAKLDSEIR